LLKQSKTNQNPKVIFKKTGRQAAFEATVMPDIF